MPKYRVVQGSVKVGEGQYVHAGDEVDLPEEEGIKLVGSGVLETVVKKQQPVPQPQPPKSEEKPKP